MLVRMKTVAEIDRFATVGGIAAKVLDAVSDEARAGRTTAQLDAVARRICAERNVNPAFLGYKGFPAALCVSVNEELVHGIPGDRILQDGDVLKIDIGVERDGFIGDAARTIRVGGTRGDKLDKAIFDCRSALMRGIAAARNGRELGDVGDAISRAAKEGGWQVVLNYGGHGVERGILHADPFVANHRQMQEQAPVRLRAGMVLALEPMFVVARNGWFARTKVAPDGWTVLAEGPAVHFEHMVAVTEIGEPRILTRAEEE